MPRKAGSNTECRACQGAHRAHTCGGRGAHVTQAAAASAHKPAAAAKAAAEAKAAEAAAAEAPAEEAAAEA